MAYTQTQLEALQAALASGELEVSHEGRRVRYRSIAELKDAIAQVQSQLNSQAGKKPVRLIRVASTKGLE